MAKCNQLCQWNYYEDGCAKPFYEVCPLVSALANAGVAKDKPMTNADRIRYEDKILHKAVEHFGTEHQLNKLTEEVGELLVAVAHWRIGKDSANHVAEEIADAIIMLKQAAMIIGVEADVAQWHMDKLFALEKRVGGCCNVD